MSGAAASSLYDIQTDNEVMVALSKFDSELIVDSFLDQIKNREMYFNTNSANIVHSYEEQFKILLNMYPDNTEEIKATRIETYRNIINIVCQHCNLQFMDMNTPDMDYYSIAVYLYDLMVSNFNDNMCIFFTNYIIKQKNSIYNLLNLNDQKRNKDSSTIYNKKIYKNPKLAVIISNLGFVLNNIAYMHLQFSDIIDNIYGQSVITEHILKYIIPTQDFYETNYLPVINGPYTAIVVTNIRIALQQYCSNPDTIEITK